MNNKQLPIRARLKLLKHPDCPDILTRLDIDDNLFELSRFLDPIVAEKINSLSDFEAELLTVVYLSPGFTISYSDLYSFEYFYKLELSNYSTMERISDSFTLFQNLGFGYFNCHKFQFSFNFVKNPLFDI
jgi:hypothetical protein